MSFSFLLANKVCCEGMREMFQRVPDVRFNLTKKTKVCHLNGFIHEGGLVSEHDFTEWMTVSVLTPFDDFNRDDLGH